ncbi:hypothetical protein AeMF1_020284 [Aphanomyces euteiches]|nr:hypothetical protein AeMF1_020284 [Aphanomyces euteiches]
MLWSWEPLLTKVNTLMTKLSYTVPAGKLSKFTNLKPKRRNSTRWSSSYEMIIRYIEIKGFIRMVADDYPDWELLHRKQDDELIALAGKLGELDKVTKELQSDSMCLAKVRSIFDEVIVDYPETVERLAIGAHVIHSPTFENACVKILNREINLLSSDEVMAVRHLVTDATNSDDFFVGNQFYPR